MQQLNTIGNKNIKEVIWPVPYQRNVIRIFNYFYVFKIETGLWIERNSYVDFKLQLEVAVC
jgi:hypothetical protein